MVLLPLNCPTCQKYRKFTVHLPERIHPICDWTANYPSISILVRSIDSHVLRVYELQSPTCFQGTTASVVGRHRDLYKLNIVDKPGSIMSFLDTSRPDVRKKCRLLVFVFVVGGVNRNFTTLSGNGECPSCRHPLCIKVYMYSSLLQVLTLATI